MILKEKTVQYLLSFLVDDDTVNVADKIGYGKIIDTRYDVFIYQSDFFDDDIFGTAKSIPIIPLQSYDGVPYLFGSSDVIKEDNTIVVHADWIASSFYLLTRYEELVNTNRDEHGRFPAKESILFKTGNIYHPLVEMWGRQLRELLRQCGRNVRKERNEFKSICLSHDVDEPWHNYSIGKGLRKSASILKHNHFLQFWPILSGLGIREVDHYYTFGDILTIDSIAKKKYFNNCESIFFCVSGCRSDMDGTFDYVRESAFLRLANRLKDSGNKIGWHISYEAAEDNELAREEYAKLRKRLGCNVSDARNHYLRSLSPSCFDDLISLGITDDYSMGYADCVGFRLGTCRVVNWINPQTGELTKLKLHPLQIMDATLIGYMNLQESEALDLCNEVINQTRLYNGDLTLLWHNETLAVENKAYTRRMYRKVVERL